MDGAVALNPARPITSLRPEVRLTLGLGLLGWVWLLFEPSAHAHWVAMLLAMMVPTLTPQVAYVRGRSFVSARQSAAATFILPYLGVWVIAGAVVAVAFGPIREQAAFAPVACLFAALWQVTPLKDAALKRCHARPVLRAFGSGARFDIIQFSITHAGICLVTCLPIMIVMLGQHDISVMVALTGIILSERAAHRPNLVATIPVLLLTAGLLALTGDTGNQHHMH